MKKLGKELEFICRIEPDGSGVEPMKGSMHEFELNETFKLRPLSITYKTYIASGMFSFVVKLKI